jgi:replicative DNA helicase
MLLADPKIYIDEQLDFTEKMHKLVYGAIYNSFNNEMNKITPIEIDNYLSAYSVNYDYYKNSNGLQYLNDVSNKIISFIIMIDLNN